MSARRASYAALLGTGALFWVGACFFPSFEKVEGTGGAGGTGGAAPAECESEGFLKPPATHTDPADPVDLYFAVRTIDMGERDLPRRPGFDLDSKCTCCTGCTTLEDDQCIYPTQLPADYCDAIEGETNGGIDNNVAKFLRRALDLSPNLIEASEALTEAADTGQWSMIVRVYNYNGEPDDSQVSVALYTAGVPTPAPPSWTLTDAWPVRSDSLADGTTIEDPLIVNHNAYVVANKLVGVFGGANGKLRLNLESALSIDLAYAIFQAELVKNGATYSLQNGVIGGMWGIADVFKALGALRRGNMPVLCKGDVAYSVVKGALCTLRDSIPNKMPSPCDSISFGLAFTAPQIKAPTTVQPLVDDSMPCAVGDDPSDDTCQ